MTFPVNCSLFCSFQFVHFFFSRSWKTHGKSAILSSHTIHLLLVYLFFTLLSCTTLRRAGATRHTKYLLLLRMFVSIYRFLDSRDENSGSHQANYRIKVQTKSNDIIKAYDMISGTGNLRNKILFHIPSCTAYSLF